MFLDIWEAIFFPQILHFKQIITDTPNADNFYPEFSISTTIDKKKIKMFQFEAGWKSTVCSFSTSYQNLWTKNN